MTLSRPTHSTISDERVTQLGDFIPRERDFRQEDLPTLDHDFFALGVVLEKTGMPAERLEGPAAAAAAAAGQWGSPYRVLQGGEADEAQEELPAGGHGH